MAFVFNLEKERKKISPMEKREEESSVETKKNRKKRMKTQKYIYYEQIARVGVKFKLCQKLLQRLCHLA